MRILGFNIAITRQKPTASATSMSRQSPPSSRWVPTHVHKKGGKYRYLYTGILEADRSAVVIYDDRDGLVWVRACQEFHDGRFKPVT